MKILVTIILGFGACVSSYAQKWKPDFLLPLSPESARLNNVDLASYLQSDFDAHRYGQNCVAELSFFISGLIMRVKLTAFIVMEL